MKFRYMRKRKMFNNKHMGFLNFFKKVCCWRQGEAELFGLILLIIGICTICAFFLPSKLLLVLLAGLMIFIGFKLFNI